MPSSTPKFAFPYPLGTDRVMDGDDAIKALAEKVEALFGTTRSASLTKSVGLTGLKPVGWLPIPQSNVTLTMSAAGLVFIRCAIDAQTFVGTGSIGYRIGTDDAMMTQLVETAGSASNNRFEVMVTGWLYVPSGASTFGIQISAYANPASGTQVNSARWMIQAMGGTPVLT